MKDFTSILTVNLKDNWLQFTAIKMDMSGNHPETRIMRMSLDEFNRIVDAVTEQTLPLVLSRDFTKGGETP